MMLNMKLIWVVLLAVQTGQHEPQDEIITHTVASGETLHSITRQYLGTDILWQENWKLNPQIENPHLLSVGQELQIIKQRIIPAERAKVIDVNNRVEKKPAGSEWKTAQAGDELVQQEGVRTYEKSSALLEFSDDSKLKVLEFSQIFLKKRVTDLSGIDSATIEVIKGDTELNWEPLAQNASDITIVMGSTISKPSTQQGRVAELRAGLTPAGDSIVSVYQGQSEVASAGAQVNVAAGMGVKVAPGQKPPKPQKLLPAPVLAADQPGRYAYTNPVISWQAVTGAQDYVIELCTDQLCDRVLKQAKVTPTQWQINQFNRSGDYHYRVAARSADEIVGYRSEPTPISFSHDEDDVQPPVIAIELIGQQKWQGQQRVIGPDSQIKLLALDELSGVKAVQYRWDQGPWRTLNEALIPLPARASVLTVMAEDQLGQAAQQEYQFKDL